MSHRWMLDLHRMPSAPSSPLLRTAVGALALLSACGGSKPPEAPKPAPTATAQAEPEPLAPPAPEPVETGKDCVTAKAECGGGVCLATVDNQCDSPVTCEFGVMVTCSTQSTAGQGRGKGRGTIPAGAEGQISAEASCAGGNVELTVPDGMSCM